VFADHELRLDDARRIREAELPGDGGLITMGIALTECGLLPFDQTIAEVRSARELGVPMVLHTGCSWGLLVTEGIPELDHHGVLGPDQVHVHCNTLDERDFRRLADNHCKVSSSPETEIQMGMGHPVIRRALEHGMGPSLSCDVISSNSGDMFAQMRIGLQFERCMRNDTFNAQNRMPERLDLTVRHALRWATANGAHAMGLEDRIGSLTIGKQADVIVIGGGRLNMTPMADPVGCLVAQANPANVKHVLVAGRFAKRDGRARARRPRRGD
jgi:cytosine/adenosine deaminase-related metal-dependent hydrolase